MIPKETACEACQIACLGFLAFCSIYLPWRAYLVLHFTYGYF